MKDFGSNTISLVISLSSKNEEMLLMLNKVCSELYRTDNYMATEVKQLINKIEGK